MQARRLLRAGTLRLRAAWYRGLSDHRLHGAVLSGAVLAVGRGRISANGAQLGYWPSPFAFDSLVYLEARRLESSISIGRGTTVNNGTVIISDGPGVSIGQRVLIGPSVQIYDSDFHSVSSSDRQKGVRVEAVVIEDDCFIAAGAIILRGVTIGKGATVGAGCIVRTSVPAGAVVIAGGSPGKSERLS